jgi:bifunctional non-homologous end joining protein LigD
MRAILPGRGRSLAVPLPTGLTPMLATAGTLPPDDGRWAYEVKWDGVRALVAVEDGQVRLTSRAGNDVTGGYPELARVAVEGPALLDGEVVAFDSAGRPDFGRLQSRMHVRGPSRDLVAATPVALVVFDVLHVGGRSLLDLPYDDRRTEPRGAGARRRALAGPTRLPERRRRGVRRHPARRAWRASSPSGGTVATCRAGAATAGSRSSTCAARRGRRRVEAGRGRAGRAHRLPAARRPHGDGWAYAGHVGTGFDAASLQMLGARLEPLRRDRPAARTTCRASTPARVWVEPALVVECDYTEWTREGRLRHPSYKGLRGDVDPRQVVRE